MSPKFQLRQITKVEVKKSMKLKPLLTRRKLLPGVKLYFSGYALTDNLNFVLLGVEKQFVLDNFIQDDILGFNFSEESVDMRIDRRALLHPIENDEYVSFGVLGSVEKYIFDLIVLHCPRGSFIPIVDWFGETVNSLVCCLSETGKPVAVVKTI